MRLSGDDFRLVFWIATIPALLSIVVLTTGVDERSNEPGNSRHRTRIRRSELALVPPAFWWAVAVASLLSLSRFSPAFLLLKVHDLGVDAAFVPLMTVVMHLTYSLVAYPFGLLADHSNRRLQLGTGVVVLICADLALAAGNDIWIATLGTALWGLQMGITQGLLAAMVADTAPDHLRGTAFGIYEVAIGVTTFVASAGAGLLWTIGGAAASYGASGAIAAAAALLLFRPLPATAQRSPN